MSVNKPTDFAALQRAANRMLSVLNEEVKKNDMSKLEALTIVYGLIVQYLEASKTRNEHQSKVTALVKALAEPWPGPPSSPLAEKPRQ